jgi:hypothetical protein
MSLFCAITVLSPLSARASPDDELYAYKEYDNYRAITYWGRISVYIDDYAYGSGDANFLGLTAKKPNSVLTDPEPEIKEHFMTEFKKYFGDLPFHNVDEGKDERLRKFLRSGKDGIERIEEFSASEEARRRALYGGRAGAVYCNIAVKRRAFPVLYEIHCSTSAEDDLRYASWQEKKNIGYSSQEHIAGEIKLALSKMLEEESRELAKMRKYGKKN